MVSRGAFRASGEGEAGRQVFLVDGDADLQVDAESVSSAWITDSEPENCEEARASPNVAAPTPERQTGSSKPVRKRSRLWRMRHRLGSSSSSSSSSGSSSSDGSSSTSTGSSSGSDRGEDEASSKRSKQAMQVDAEGPRQAPNSAPEQKRTPLKWLESGKRYRCLAVAEGFLRLEDIQALHAIAKHSSVKEINDRKGYLAFQHRVWRFELQLRALAPDLYRRLLALMHQADAEKWARMRKNSKKRQVYPEVEYIDYDVEYEGKPCFIEPHVDNKSAVTLVAMLSPSADYAGGRSCFRRPEGRSGHRELSLQMGDAVLFRGEKLLHW
eukprot:CAMPEP_0171216740 /NCGR_PEP_ID=MMETSP0790-20130122/32333_1 /TAXON_ID=2925 /ORGANISM="Alexandrium catenella, Strain OF101" /LENGTH=325 /DNA_ID=CAMNT_0011682523 /DNA_START=64 /DNA_END=1038 /DNA_ORIENTATION=-